MRFLNRHKGVSLIILFCMAVLVILVIAVILFECKMNRTMVDAKETLGAFASYYGAIFGGILSGVIAIGGVFLSLYFYQERYREEDIARVRPYLKLEATNLGHSHGMLSSAINISDIEDPQRDGYPIEFQAKNIGNGYLKMHSIRFNEMNADETSLSFVLNVDEETKFTICVDKNKMPTLFYLTMEYYDSRSNLYVQDYKVKCIDSYKYSVESGKPRKK